VSDQKRDVERLIEDGLIRYGGGDLAGALAAWERALIQEPGNLQAIGYVDYVRLVFEQLNRPTSDELVVPFGLGHGDSPDYQIEMSPEPPDDDAVERSGMLQDGWLISQDDERDTIERLYSLAEPPGTLDLDYDEPQLELTAGVQLESLDTTEFGDVTPVRHQSHSPAHHAEDRDDFDGPELEATPGFIEAAMATPGFSDAAESTPGFSDESAGNATDLRRPDLGFVQSRMRPSSARPRASTHGADERDRARSQREARGLAAPSSSNLGNPGSAGTPGSGLVSSDPRSALADPQVDSASHDAMSEDYANLELAPFIEELPLGADIGEPDTESMPRVRLETLTRDLGLAGRYRPSDDAKFGEESPTRELPRPSTEDDEKTQAWIGGPPAPKTVDTLETLTAQILPKLDRDAPPHETRDDRLRRRIATLVELGQEWNRIGDGRRAVAAVDLALKEDPDSALAQKLIQRNRDAVMTIFQSYVGSLERRPSLARGLDDLGTSLIGARAAFLLSRVDGQLTFDEILDVSGMPRLEAFRYLCQLLLRGILTTD
jgi:hypothetical protein